MTRLRIFLARLRGIFGQDRIEGDLQEQIAAHLAEATDEYVRQGMSPEEARRAARRSFGGVTQVEEAHRDLRSFAWLEDARRDLRHALRSLRRAPGFAAVAILTLALANGAATAIFSVVDAALLRPLPYEKPEEVVFINVGIRPEQGMSPSAESLDRWRAAGRVFARIGMGRVTGHGPVIVDAGVPERVTVGTASEDFLEVFGIAPLVGRPITAEDTRPGSPPVVLLGHRYWQSRLDRAQDVLERSIVVNGERATIIGVLPEGFYPDTMVWRPHVVPSPMRAMHGTGTPVYGRLRAGVDIDTAARELSADLAAAGGKPELRVLLTTLYEDTTKAYGRTVAVLCGAVVLIVLIACVNVAGLLLARGATRLPEIAVRTSIGASRGRLVRQLLAEGAVLALIGTGAGVMLAFVMLDAIVALIPLRLPDNVTPAINLQVLAFAVSLSAATCLLFGLAPALTLSRTQVTPHAAAGRLRHASALTRRGGQALIAAEIAMALVLVAGAALMIRSFTKIMAIEVGLEPDAFVTMEVVPVDVHPAAQAAYYAALLTHVRQIPGVSAVGAADRPPLDGSGSYTDASVDGRSITITRRRVMPGYFEAVGLPLRQGRYPTDADYSAGRLHAVLSESAARVMFPDEPAVGHEIVLEKKVWTVVGVVGDARNKTPLTEDRERPGLYLPFQPEASSVRGSGLTVVVRPQGRVHNLAEQLRRAALAPGQPVIVERIRSGRDWFRDHDHVATPRQRTTLLGLLGALGLLLTLVGIFGTTAYAVARRTREVGIRMALGARPRQMVGAIVRDAAGPVALGITLGLAGAVVVTDVIRSFLYETDPTDPLAMMTTVVLVAAAALIAAWIPARRAASVDPVQALRAD